MVLKTRPNWNQVRKQELIECWYREQLKAAAQPLIEKWERLMGVRVAVVDVQPMKNPTG